MWGATSNQKRFIMQGILGEKVGMTAIFSEDGQQIPVTVIRVAGNQVCGKRTVERDGYSAIIVGFGERPAKRATRPERGFFAAANMIVERDGREFVKRYVREFRMSPQQVDAYEIGATLSPSEIFNEGGVCDVTGTSKGRGFAGVMKRHNFRGGKATHGVHEYFRHGGSIGMNTTPARVFKKRKMPGQLGNARSTVQNVAVVQVLEDEGLLLVRGGVPGPNGGMVMVRKAVKRRH